MWGRDHSVSDFVLVRVQWLSGFMFASLLAMLLLPLLLLLLLLLFGRL